MRIGCLQFAPQVGETDNNLNRADSVLNRVGQKDLDDLDLLVLPEMAFSGYNFKSEHQITPYLEPAGAGISALWARTLALKHNTVVAVGYPEKVDTSRQGGCGSPLPEYYNSVILVNGEGDTMGNYRKNFLYYTDETWAMEGSGFYSGHSPVLGDIAMGICMDINPYRFEAPWHAFEFAFHVLEVKANLVILSMAWLTQEDSRDFSRMPQEPDMETLTYWVQRLEPVIRAEKDEETIVVFANRSGSEHEALYAGTSAVLGIKNGEVNVYGLLGRGVKELLIVDTENPPFAKLVNRPDKETAQESPAQESQQESTPVEQPTETPTTERPAQTSTQTPRQSTPPPRSPSTKSEGRTPREKPPTPKLTIPPLDRDWESVPGSSHCSTAETEDSIPTPSAPSPVPMSLRPKLNLFTSDEQLFPGPGRITPPVTAFDDLDDISGRYYWLPPTSSLDTPEEPQWLVPALPESPTLNVGFSPIVGTTSQVPNRFKPSRARSADRVASVMADHAELLDRPCSPKSRNASRGRKSSRSGSKDPLLTRASRASSITIAASPSCFKTTFQESEGLQLGQGEENKLQVPELPEIPRPVSRLGHYRSKSESRTALKNKGPAMSNHSQHRAVSRGREPACKVAGDISRSRSCNDFEQLTSEATTISRPPSRASCKDRLGVSRSSPPRSRSCNNLGA